MENVILVDVNMPAVWAFHKGIEEATNKKWTVIRCASSEFHGKIESLIRYWYYFYLALKIFLKRKNYGTVLAWQQFYGLILAFYLRLFRVKKYPEITVMTFVYKKNHH